MTQKGCVLLFACIGSTVGGYLPSLLGYDMFSGWGILASAAGGLLGIWAGYRIGQNYF